MAGNDIGVLDLLNCGIPSPKAAPAVSVPAAGKAAAAKAPSGGFRSELEAACRGSEHGFAASRPEREAAADDHGAGPKPSAAEKPDNAPTAAAPNERKAEEIAFLLLQLIQGAGKPDPPAKADPDDGAPAEAVLGEADPGALAPLLEWLSQEAAAGGRAASREETRPALPPAELMDRLSEAIGEKGPAALSGKIHRRLAELRLHLSGAAWGRIVRDLSGGELPPVPPDALPGEGAVAESADRPAAIPAAALQGGADASSAADSLQPAARLRAEGPAAAEPDAVAARPVVSEKASAAPPPASPGAADPRPDLSAERRADRSSVHILGGRTAGEASPAPDGDPEPGAASRVAGLPDKAADAEGPLPEGDAAASADAPEPGIGEGRMLRPPEAATDRPVAAAAARDREPARGPERAGVFDQIVQRAVLQVKNEQSEMRIQLKPDFLGNVRMQIVAENQQVSVRILTELPSVRDLIAGGIQQLKSELQQQGLQVDRLEVFVSDDYERNPRRQTTAGRGRRPASISTGTPAGEVPAPGRLENAWRRHRLSAAVGIDMFA